MRSFSERMGLKQSKTILQTNSMDMDLRNSLWNMLHQNYWRQANRDFYGYVDLSMSDNENLKELCRQLWRDYFKWTLDTLSYNFDVTRDNIKSVFFKCEWNEVYDIIDFIANTYPDDDLNKEFMDECNEILKRELSGFRFVGGTITKMTSKEEIAEIEEALQVTDVLKPVNTHLSKAIELCLIENLPIIATQSKNLSVLSRQYAT